MQFYVARRASLGDHAVTICFVAIGILRPMLDQHLVRMVFAPLACRIDRFELPWVIAFRPWDSQLSLVSSLGTAFEAA